MAVIDVHALGKSYGQTAVLHDVDLRVEAGHVLGLLGANGAGKTTLIKILCGLLKPDRGGGTVLGLDLLRRHNDIRGRVSLVATGAEVGTDNNLTVRQNLEFWALVYRLRGRQAVARIEELLQRLDLLDKADAWPMHISAGQRQRLSLARSLLGRNPLVFLDEPTNKLDADGVRSVRRLVADMNRAEGVTIVLTTHVMEEAEELCSHIAMLDGGRLVAFAPTAELVARLRIVRPVEVRLRSIDVPDLSTLPGVTGIERVERHGEELAIHLQSQDLRVTTPALLERARGSLVRIVARPLTLHDVFQSVAGRPR